MTISYEEFNNLSKREILGKDLKPNNLYYIDIKKENNRYTVYSAIVEEHYLLRSVRDVYRFIKSIRWKNVNLVCSSDPPSPYFTEPPNFKMETLEMARNVKYYELVEPLAQDIENKKNNITEMNQYILEKKAEPVNLNESNVSFIGEDYREAGTNFEKETAKWPSKSGGKTKRKNRKLSIRSKQKGKKSRKNRKFSRKSKKN